MNINGLWRLIRSQAKTVNYIFGSFSKFSVKPVDAYVIRFLLIFFSFCRIPLTTFLRANGTINKSAATANVIASNQYQISISNLIRCHTNKLNLRGVDTDSSYRKYTDTLQTSITFLKLKQTA